MIIAQLFGIFVIVLGIVSLFLVKNKIASLSLAVMGILIMIISGCITYIPSGYVGVRTYYGEISDKTCAVGFNFHAPFIEEISKVNCKQQEKDLNGLRVWSETSERTEIYCENIVVDYQINAEYAAWIWANVEEWDTNLVKQTSIESGIKAATKRFNDIDVTDRAKIEAAAKECIQNALNEKYGNQIVNVVSVTIGNMNFSDAYNQAIEQRAQSKLAAETAQYANLQAKEKAEAEAEQKRIAAKGDAEAKKIAAEGDAEAIKIRAEAEAEANKKVADSLTDELIELKKIEKWNGKMPKVTGSGSTIVDLGTGTSK